MYFKILSHAGIRIKEKNFTLIIDPWILGSCYWRSWWNYPEINKSELKDLNADAIYITHLHWDHFHGPSLVKFFDKNIKIFVPKVLTTRMIDDLNYLGFKNVVEIPHGNSEELVPGFEIFSYQFGPGVDSALMISTKNYNLFNANDCKTFGLSLNRIKKRHGKIDFTFRSHSSANAIPYCIESHEKEFSTYRTQKDYCEEFSAFCQKLETTYAIPFASNHCFLHKETKKFNSLAANPEMIPAIFNKMKIENKSTSEVIIMPPGSTWNSKTEEFEIRKFNYKNSDSYINDLSKINEKKLKNQYEIEDQTKANFSNFKNYFEKFIKSIPDFLKKQFKIPIQFIINDVDGKKTWLIDITRNIISEKNN